VLARGATCDTNAIYVVSVDGIARKEGLWGSNLVADDPPTHLVILLTTSSVSDPFTASSGGPSPTHPEWGGDLLPHRGTLLGGVRHVEIGYSSPAGRSTTGVPSWRTCLVGLQEGYY